MKGGSGYCGIPISASAAQDEEASSALQVAYQTSSHVLVFSGNDLRFLKLNKMI